MSCNIDCFLKISFVNVLNFLRVIFITLVSLVKRMNCNLIKPSVEITVPGDRVALVIGPGGNIIKKLQVK